MNSIQKHPSLQWTGLTHNTRNEHDIAATHPPTYAECRLYPSSSSTDRQC